MVWIIIPVQKSTATSEHPLSLIFRMRELPLFVPLVTLANRVPTTILFQHNGKGWDQYTNATDLVIMAIVLFVNRLVNKPTRVSVDKGIGG